MPLQIGDPVVVPSTIEKVYPHIWIYNLIIHAPSTTSEARMTIEYYPMSDDGELYTKDGIKTITTNEFLRCSREVSEVGNAYNAVLAAIIPANNWIIAEKEKAEEAANNPPDPE